VSFVEEIIIKKYPNRRLYNTNTSAYINLSDVYTLVASNVNFKIVDTQNVDITKSILIQVILEQETKGYATLPISFLRQIILFYNFQGGKVIPEVMENLSEFLEKQGSVMESFLSMYKGTSEGPIDLINKNYSKIFKNAFNYFAKGK
jgi:polyhydroxyalkanoate synthesis repressor PhaR